MHKYPKLCLLLLFCVLAYVLYHLGVFDAYASTLHEYGYYSAFLGGMLFSFGFTAPFGIAIFAEIYHAVNPFLAALLGGLGALIVDVCIFSLIRFSIFHDEVHQLKSSRIFLRLHALLHHEKMPPILREYLLWSFAGIVIASPLPDEFGIALISGISDMKGVQFMILCFTMNALGILVLLSIMTAV